MSIKEIPSSFMATCDCCTDSIPITSNRRPAHWSQLILERAACDWQGAPVADGSIKLLLCDSCSQIIAESINTAAKKLGPVNE